MRGRRTALIVMVAVTLHGAFLVVHIADEVESPREDRKQELDLLLSRLDRVSELFLDTALRFGCEETISWTRERGSGGRQKFGYVYTHSDSRGLEDYRTWVGLGTKGSVRRELSPAAYGVPTYLRRAYLWIFLFRANRQHLYRYQIVREQTVLDRPAVGIRFEPIPPYREGINDWFGTAWVDRETFQILSVEAYRPDEHATKQAFDAYVTGGPGRVKAFAFERVTTEFTEEKNGMRFPGTVELDRSRYRTFRRRGTWRFKRIPTLVVRQSYRNYEFFSVRTTEEIKSLVMGDIDSDEDR